MLSSSAHHLYPFLEDSLHSNRDVVDHLKCEVDGVSPAMGRLVDATDRVAPECEFERPESTGALLDHSYRGRQQVLSKLGHAAPKLQIDSFEGLHMRIIGEVDFL